MGAWVTKLSARTTAHGRPPAISGTTASSRDSSAVTQWRTHGFGWLLAADERAAPRAATLLGSCGTATASVRRVPPLLGLDRARGPAPRDARAGERRAGASRSTRGGLLRACGGPTPNHPRSSSPSARRRNARLNPRPSPAVYATRTLQAATSGSTAVSSTSLTRRRRSRTRRGRMLRSAGPRSRRWRVRPGRGPRSRSADGARLWTRHLRASGARGRERSGVARRPDSRARRPARAIRTLREKFTAARGIPSRPAYRPRKPGPAVSSFQPASSKKPNRRSILANKHAPGGDGDLRGWPASRSRRSPGRSPPADGAAAPRLADRRAAGGGGEIDHEASGGLSAADEAERAGAERTQARPGRRAGTPPRRSRRERRATGCSASPVGDSSR